MGKPRSAVFLANVPKSFKPAHIHSQPDEILGGKYLARRLSIANAVAFANAYNRTHLPSEGTYRHKWAIAIAGLDRLYDHQHVNRGPTRQRQLSETDNSTGTAAVAQKLYDDQHVAEVRSSQLSTADNSAERAKPAATEGGAN